ncbi:MAG: N-acetylmuramoyl-L-alanine amidase [Chthonomonas sp.]|nr:N-acetylmuramoyl-L-alanine amidase [Chthonomonas sp.]
MRSWLALCLWLCFASFAWSTPTVICLDPGHPSEVGPGTRGKVLTEMGFAWTIAKQLERQLQKEGFKVVMTKSSEKQHVTNRERAQIANRSKAALMLRLHCDYAPGESGFATFFADTKGKQGNETGPSDAVLDQVRPMAKAFHIAATKELKGKLGDRGLRTDRQTAVGKKYGALIGSIFSEVPSVLVEMCVLNNPKDEKWVRTEAGKSQMVRALLAGIRAALGARLEPK